MRNEKLVVLLCLFYCSNVAICQEIDTSRLLSSALMKSIDYTAGIWSEEEIISILKQKNQVRLRKLESKGLKGIFFFQLDFPEFGLIKSENGNITELFDPDLFQREKVFVFDLITNNLYVLDDTFSDDTLDFYYLVQHRLENYSEHIYKKKVWLAELAIESVSMEGLWRKGTLLRKLRYSLLSESFID